jgi:phage gp45-like
VLVLPREGSAEHGIIVGSAFAQNRPPPAAEAGEMWLVHKSGTAIKLTNDGRVHIEGDLYVTGDVFDRRGALGHLRDIYNQHTHHTSNGGVTYRPDQQD